MDKERVITTSTASVFQRKPKRIRKRRCFTIDDSTFDLLEEIARNQKLGCASRAIDNIALFYNDNVNAIHVKLAPSILKRLTAHFLYKGTLPAQGLAAMAEKFVSNLQTKK